MRAKTILTIFVVFAIVWFVVTTVRLNQGLVTARFAMLEPLELELWMLMLGAFAVGAALILTFDIAGVARRFARDRRQRREYRAHEEVESLYLQGLDAMVNARYEKALDRFEKVLEREPSHTNAAIKQGDSLRALKRHREAAEVLERASRMSSDNLMALYSLSDVYLDAGADERARITLERIIETDPDTTVSAHRKLRDLLARELEWERASDVQKKLVSMVSNEEREKELSMAKGIRLGVGMQLAERGRTQDAIDSLTSIIEEDETFVPAYVRLGEVLASADQTDEAVRIWREGFEKTGSTEPLSALQSFYLRVDQPEEAIGVWKRALVLSDSEVPLRYCLGKLYYRLFMLEEALREFQMIEDRVSGLPALHLYIARILERKGDLAAALAKTKMLVAEVEGLIMDYVCNACSWRSSEWSERCTRCGAFSSVALHLPAAKIPEPSIEPSPTWSTP
jgi:lipopolysaccharide biosynthesis regulator YciM